MSYADKIFVDMCRNILDNGTDTKGEKVRPKWDDGSFAYTIKKFGVVNRYDLKKEFPAITLRKTGFKNCLDELLWIWQKKSNNVHDLNSHIWDAWADETGSIGKAYGYQLGIKHHYKEGDMDQVDRVLYDLKHNPYSRRIMTNIYNHEDLHEMNLYPCAYSMTFNVTKNEETGNLVLNGILNQRSQDVLTANNWNVCQYAALIHMFAQVNDMEVGEFIHVIADAHIYDKHVPLIEELITREQHPAPKLWINPEIKNFYDFTVDDQKLEDYVTGPQIKNITVAEAIRYLLERGLSLTMFTEEQDTIRRFIREEIENTLAVTMKQYMDRLIKMQAVTTRVSSAALQCNVAVLAENYIDSATPEEILANALRQSCRITRTKPKSDAEYLAEAHEWLNADLDTPSDK